MSDRRAGIAVVLLGLVTAAIVQAVAPSGRPLYDGIVPTEPYVWLQPPPGHPGGAKGDRAELPLDHGKSPEILLATPELNPQAQIQAIAGALVLPPGATRLRVAVEPTAAPVPPPSGYIDGNVYAITIVDQAGRPATAPASAYVSIILRSADPTLTVARIERFDGSAWHELETEPNGDGAFFAVVTEFGDFAVVASGASPYATVAPTPAPATPPPATPAATPSGGPPATGSPVPTPGSPSVAPIAGSSLVGVALVGVVGLLVVVGLALEIRRRTRQ